VENKPKTPKPIDTPLWQAYMAQYQKRQAAKRRAAVEE
jgi:hypothetical protein